MDAGRVIGNLFALADRNGQLITCQHEARLSVDEFGFPQYGTPTPFTAMWMSEQQRVRTAEGNEVWSTGQLAIEQAFPMTPRDRITLPDGTQPAILRVDSSASHNNLLYFQVFF